MVMQTIDASTLRKRLFDVLRRLPSDGPVAIMRNDKVVARLIAAQGDDGLAVIKPIIDHRTLARLCQKHGIRRLALFGSVLRDDFDADSDVDVLIDPERGRLQTLKAYGAAQDALEALFGRRVDMVKWSQVQDDSGRSHTIRTSAKVIYGA